METEKTYYTCRLCLETCEIYHSLFTEGLVNLIESLTSIKIEDDKKLPSTCCAKCLTEVSMAYKVQQQIIETDKILRESLEDVMDYRDRLGDHSYILYIDSDQDTSESKSVVNPLEQSSESNSTDILLEDSSDQINNLKTQEPNDSSKESENTNIESTEQTTECDKQQFKNNLSCDKCNIKFESYRAFYTHALKHKLTKCPVCSAFIRSDNFKRHYELHNAPPEVCQICGKTAKNKESLRGHIFYQHNDNPVVYKCDECNMEFKKRYKYTLHVRKVHRGVRDHECEICGKKFFTLADTRKHVQMTHMKARPYICSYCNKGFSSNYALRTHTLQHTLEKPFRCELCSSGFRQKVSLKGHMLSKHNIEMEKLQTNTANIKQEPS